MNRIAKVAGVVRSALVLGASMVLCLGMPGCAGHRPARTPAELLTLRQAHDADYVEQARTLIQRLVAHTKTRYDEYATGRAAAPPTVELLVISGGGDWGAFGAGFLKGWSRVQGAMALPQFDAVTGVSTGALIAPFAFLGDAQSLDTIASLYRHPQPDWVKQRWPLYFLPANASFATVPGLEREMRERVDVALLRRVADASREGRFLLVNTTDIDDGGMWVWDVGHEAQRAVESGNVDRVHRILLASAGIPGAFPFREIDGSLYVDGGVTGNILYGGRVREEQSFPALWVAAYPHLPVPTIRYWVIFNNQLRPLPQVTAPTWPAVVTRSLEMGTRAATLTSMRHLFAQAAISRLMRGATIEVRFVAVPDDFVPPKPGTFDKETMNALADLGEKMGEDASSWRIEAP
jgi:predicted acylesterase/phospholipase RssA